MNKQTMQIMAVLLVILSPVKPSEPMGASERHPWKLTNNQTKIGGN
jgi:hypothetical protein